MTDFVPIVLDGVVYERNQSNVLYAIGSAESKPATPAAPATVAAPAATAVATATATAVPAAASGAPDVRFLWSFTGDGADLLDTPQIVRRSPDGKLWVLDLSGRAFIFDLDGNLEEVWGSRGHGPGQFEFSGPGGWTHASMTFAPDGSFYIVDAANFRIQYFAPDRTLLGTWGSQGTATVSSCCPSRY